MKSFLLTGIVAVFLLSSTGCQIVSGTKDAFAQSMRMFRPKGLDSDIDSSDGPDPWGFVGKEGRSDLDRERDPDRWWQNLVMSQEARNIERNLGID